MSAVTAVVSVVVVTAILLAVYAVVMPAVMVTVGIYDPPWDWFYHHNARWRRGGVVVPVSMPVAVVIARIVGAVGAGSYG
ncbi:hypothetical protein GCM10010967_52640 [Dyadobacter beijingensis]|uniref:Uncharacterized protein n=1 Tax=Dyadobacter beijingensis TaxID=365489 RepID=A0ABQ2IJE5_9BACT|nr:hypothetical protein GCM10010967_52640 [Dyadobacter beijingensis]